MTSRLVPSSLRRVPLAVAQPVRPRQPAVGLVRDFWMVGNVVRAVSVSAPLLLLLEALQPQPPARTPSPLELQEVFRCVISGSLPLAVAEPVRPRHPSFLHVVCGAEGMVAGRWPSLHHCTHWSWLSNPTSHMYSLASSNSRNVPLKASPRHSPASPAMTPTPRRVRVLWSGGYVGRAVLSAPLLPLLLARQPSFRTISRASSSGRKRFDAACPLQ